ncbi:MAG: hypothetical protein NC218_10485 [Acetobacter sp.]|nr:hypothetical protein [Acetobacter sp.]
MLKKSSLLLALAILLSGCTREVYLQAVPCAEGNCECPCISETRECCPETAMMTETIQYQVYDVPAREVTYIPCPTKKTTKTTTTTRTCRKVCREVRTN